MASKTHVSPSAIIIREKARELEIQGNAEEAARLYEQLITEPKQDEFPFNRLMVIYRKLKQYQAELKVINKAIKLFEDHANKSARGNSERQKKLTTLSNAFLKSSGLQDKKGNLLYIPEPLSRWKKRKTVVEKKLK